jgi:AcrR family transcriptional regulator
MGRPPRIDRDAVITHALELADQEDIASMTMAAVAARLHVTPMALYRHVANKDDLLDGLVERLLAEIADQVALTEADSLETAVRRFALAAGRTASTHPVTFPLLLARPARTDTSRLVREQVYSLLKRSGVPEDRVCDVERLVTTTVLGMAAGHASRRFPVPSEDTEESTTRFVVSALNAFIANGRPQ